MCLLVGRRKCITGILLRNSSPSKERNQIMGMTSDLRNPTAFLQAQENAKELTLNLLRYASNHPSKTNPTPEHKVVSDLFFSLINKRDSFAIAANQRGWKAPLFVSRWPLQLLNELPMAAYLTPDQNKILLDSVSPVAYKNPRYWVDSNVQTHCSPESCLSWHYGQEPELMKRFLKIHVEVLVLNVEAFRNNRKRCEWNKATFTLEGLAAQIFQHEYDHLSGGGIWCYREI